MTAPQEPEEPAGVRSEQAQPDHQPDSTAPAPAEPHQPAPGAGRPEAADGEWHRVHPISPWVRGWVILVAMLFFATQSFGEDMVRTLIGQGEFQDAGRLWITLAIYGAVFVVMVVIYYFSWRFTKYQLAEEQVLLDTGVIFRQHRRVRYDRVQAVDIRQPLVARIFGLAELKFEAADGGSTAMQLAFIKEDEARILRAEIMGRAAGIRAGADPEEVARRGAVAATAESGEELSEAPGEGPRPAEFPQQALPEAPEHVMLKVPAGRMIGSVLLSTAMIVMISIIVLLVLGAWILDLTIPQDGEDNWWLILLFVLIPFAFSLVGVAWGGFNKGYNFTVATSPDGLRLRYGLLETSQQTVPPGRVQAVRISQGLLWRAFGWYRMSVNVAGYGAVTEGSGADKSTVLPVGTIEDVMRVLSVVAPDPGVEDAPEVIREGITGSGGGQGFTHSPRRVWWLDPLTWKRNAYRSTDTMVLLRSGRIERYLVLMPHERIQSIGLHQGPLERRLRVATLRFHSTAGPVVPLLPHADVDVAVRLFHEEADIAAVSRRMRDRNQWMREDELARFEQRTQQVIEQ
ncbi:PH domain-containing protein [Citricoccus muralis]|uniref:Putative membrane protein n=1 Tax=Citricoccus muralis TaxID=169134 RepID=A0A3D9LEN2_9MICC|nr:PH domain-containing protein [Citricoccus muralis]REE04622.1 putative membrane protein [Citricoccus muralis]